MDWGAFFDDPENWMKLLSSGVGFFEAKDKSKSTMNPRDMWNMGNPDVNTPFYNTQTDWNGGNPITNRQMSPQLQQAFDEIVWGALADGRDPRQMSDNMGRIQNLQEQNQLGRYGQTGDPYSPKADAGGREPYDPIGSGTNYDEQEPQYDVAAGAPTADGGRNERAYDEINRAVMDRDLAAGNLTGGGNNQNGDFWAQDKSGGSEEYAKYLAAIAAGVATKSPRLGRKAFDLSRNENWWGGNEGMIAPDSDQYVTPNSGYPQYAQGKYYDPYNLGYDVQTGQNPVGGYMHDRGIMNPNSRTFVPPNRELTPTERIAASSGGGRSSGMGFSGGGAGSGSSGGILGSHGQATRIKR
jgi:hypothetical protein